MAGPNTLLTKTFNAGGAITKYRLLKIGAADDAVIEAVGVTAPIVGVSSETVASGDRIDVDMAGLLEVELGGTVARGDYLTATAAGKAVKAAPAAGANNDVAGVAMASGVIGDIINVLMTPGRIQG